MSVSSHRAHLAALVVTLLPLGLLVSPASGADGTTGTMLVAHRGSSMNAPENTLPAFDRAVAEHADRVSIDVHLTSDGVPVVLHDMSLARTTNVEQRFPGRSPWYVGDFTLAQVRSLDAGSWFGKGAFAGTRVPTLDDVLTELGPSPTGLTLEIKNPGSYGGAAGVGRAVLAVLSRHPDWRSSSSEEQPRLVVESFDWGFLDDLHTLDDTLPLVPLSTEDITTADLDAHPYVDELDVGWRGLTANGVAAARARGIRVGTWTPNDEPALTRMITMGLDLITTDATERLAALLRAAGSTWAGTTWPTASPRRLTLRAPASAVIGSRAPLRVIAVDEAGAPMPWQRVTLQRLTSRGWRDLARTGTDSRGSAALAPSATDGLVLRAVSGSVATARVTVPTHLPALAVEPSLPQPSIPLTAQPRRATPGAHATVSRLSRAAWRATVGRSSRTGCPATRDGLRRVTTTYWGFDGYRHRGSVAVARKAATPLARVFRRLYDAHLPLRTLRRVEELGSYRTALGRALAGDATFGFACQPVPGDHATYGSHSRGLMVTVNPWENPTVPGKPDTAWLDRALPSPVVLRKGTAVVEAFAAQGFAWRGARGRYGEFRYVR